MPVLSLGDPFTLQLIKGALQAIADGMFGVLRRTGQSPVIYEVLGYAVGLTDVQGQLIMQGEGVTGFLGTFPAAVRQILEKFASWGNLNPGDFVADHDPCTGGRAKPVSGLFIYAKIYITRSSTGRGVVRPRLELSPAVRRLSELDGTAPPEKHGGVRP